MHIYLSEGEQKQQDDWGLDDEEEITEEELNEAFHEENQQSEELCDQPCSKASYYFETFVKALFSHSARGELAIATGHALLMSDNSPYLNR